jgi:hypothetical protein
MRGGKYVGVRERPRDRFVVVLYLMCTFQAETTDILPSLPFSKGRKSELRSCDSVDPNAEFV